MDTVQHAAQGACLAMLVHQPAPVIAVAAVAGAAPDVIGFAEKVIKRDKSTWQWYLAWHSDSAKYVFGTLVIISLIVQWKAMQAISTALLIHVLLDSFTHGDGKRWWVAGEGLKYEVIGWIITALALLALVPPYFNL